MRAEGSSRRPPLTPVWILGARPDQGDLRRSEHASVSGDLVRALGLEVGQQVIIRRDADTFALYTVVDEGSGKGTVRMGRSGRARLSGAEEERFAAFIDRLVVDPTATQEEVRRGEKLLERLDDDGRHRGLVVLAPHGGDVERFTDAQAEHVGRLLSDLDVSCWRCQGWKPGGGAAARWHITSTEISAVSFPRLATIAARGFRHAVSFHGFTDAARPDILVGGAAPEPIKRLIRAEIAAAAPGLTVEITGAGDRLGGTGEANLVNRLSGGNGVQLEQQPHTRAGTVVGTHAGSRAGTHADTRARTRADQPGWQAIAAAVARAYRVILTEDEL